MSGQKRRASEAEPRPSRKKIKLTVNPETAAEKDNFKLIRSLDRNTLQPQTIERLNKHNYDPFVKDLQVKEIIRSGSICNKCELVESEGAKRPYKIIAKADIDAKECIGVYMGTLIEESRCTEINIWQYNLPSTKLPKTVPSLILDGSKAANETKFIHNALWYNKPPNIMHMIVWDVESHLPHIIFRATRQIKAGEDILLEWEEPQPENKEDKEANGTDDTVENNNNNEKAPESEAAKLKRQEAEKKQKQKQEAAAKKKQEAEKKAEQLAAAKNQKERDAEQLEAEKKQKQEAVAKKKQEAEKKQKERESQRIKEKQQKEIEDVENKKQEIKKRLQEKKNKKTALKDAILRMTQRNEEADKRKAEIEKEAAEARRAEEIAKERQALKEIEEKNRRIERAKQKKEEEKRKSDADQELREDVNNSKKAQHGIVQVTPKQRNNTKSTTIETTHESDLEEQLLEVEPVEISKPMTEINFFSATISNNVNSNNSTQEGSVVVSNFDMEDRVFDLNAEIEVSDEEDELIIAEL